MSARPPAASAWLSAPGLRRWGAVAAALLALNAALTLHNVWPTLAIRWQGEFSIEVALLVLALALRSARGAKPLSRAAVTPLAVLIAAFALARYAEVTAPALYGRPVNLYWDAPHVANVVAMLARAADPLVVAGAAAAVLAALAGLIAGAAWCIARLSAGFQDRSLRGTAGAIAAALLVVFVAQRATGVAPELRFSIPVAQTYARQLGLLLAAARAGEEAPRADAPVLARSDLAALEGRDVLIVFLESYGAVTYDEPQIAQALESVRRDLGRAIRETDRGVLSAFVRSPTFGGSSWLAHLSLLSGVEVRDADHYARLMASSRATLPAAFGARGYRSVALMPGLRQSWPEGAFYGFARIYGAGALEYPGPEFGWWRIPDQFALARLDALEVQGRPRAPLFAFFPTISTHMPFRPTPPYQRDWARLLDERPYDEATARAAIARSPEWTNLGPSYAEAVAYALETLAGYLRLRTAEDPVVVVLGDHQPPAAVSGPGASWEVPVHVILRAPAVREALLARGFRPGLEPARPALGGMHELAPLLLEAFAARPPPGERLRSSALLATAALP